jgi:3-hydroxyisobutyrate dehydrogenase-like beta-hydroxyacid dehydrogenase
VRGRSVRKAASAVEAVRGAQLIISAVTADQDLAAAQAVAAGIDAGAYFLDLNSCSPGQKAASAEAIEAAGGRYVEAAVMAPIDPRRIASPMLLGGPHIHAFLADADGLGFAGATAYSEIVGRAAATKLCRSVMIKGVEALLTESMLAARHYGVEDVVLASLSDLLPLPDWQVTAQYMISRSLEHGVRRAEEMREAARTVAEAGVAPVMCGAIAARQDWAAAHKAAISPDLQTMLDAINREVAP